MMVHTNKFYLLGSGWISATGYGFFGDKPRFSKNTDFMYPDLKAYLPELPSRFGRFDSYTKLTFSTAVLALHDANLLERDGKKNIGIIVGSSSGVDDNDISYFETTRDGNGAFTSPNLFSYTLPNVALGEIAVYFNLVGPTFCVGNNHSIPGSDLVLPALSLLQSGECSTILVGWVDVAENTRIQSSNTLKGAAFTLLTAVKDDMVKAEYEYNYGIAFTDFLGGYNE
jgi:3-oxoacyl-(acyl-carrier-protein) synthase